MNIDDLVRGKAYRVYIYDIEFLFIYRSHNIKDNSVYEVIYFDSHHREVGLQIKARAFYYIESIRNNSTLKLL